jgi:hypothetical protein
VADQDNILNCLSKIEDCESSSNEKDILQCEKRIKRLEGQMDPKSRAMIEEFSKK